MFWLSLHWVLLIVAWIMQESTIGTVATARPAAIFMLSNIHHRSQSRPGRRFRLTWKITPISRTCSGCWAAIWRLVGGNFVARFHEETTPRISHYMTLTSCYSSMNEQDRGKMKMANACVWATGSCGMHARPATRTRGMKDPAILNTAKLAPNHRPRQPLLEPT